MRKTLLLTIGIILGICFIAQAQKANKDSIVKKRGLFKNSIYGELFGNAGLYSINFEKGIVHSNEIFLTIRLGGEVYGGGNYSPLEVCFPLIVNGIFKINRAIYFEMGAGAGYSYDSFIDPNGYNGSSVITKSIFYTSDLGLRFQGKRGCVYRISYIHTFNNNDENLLFEHIGLSFGNSFN